MHQLKLVKGWDDAMQQMLILSLSCHIIKIWHLNYNGLDGQSDRVSLVCWLLSLGRARGGHLSSNLAESRPIWLGCMLK